MAKLRTTKSDFKKRTSNTESISSIINNVLKTQNLQQPLNDKRAEDAWQEVAGAVFLKYTTSAKAQKGVLYIGLSSSIVRNELMMAKNFIIKNINKNIGKDVVKDIIVFEYQRSIVTRHAITIRTDNIINSLG
jgi:hypothetical protein